MKPSSRPANVSPVDPRPSLPPGSHPLDLGRSAYSSLYFFIGRHTGVLFYFPAALALLLPILRRPDRVSGPLLAGVIAILGFYLVWMPENYFGGSTFVGNRYFLGVFPALLVAAKRLPSSRQLAIAWAVALVAWSSAVYSARSVRHLDNSSQAHAYAGLFRHLPFESTAQRIDGLTERFWAEDFVRFLDPFAAVAPWSLRLDSSHPETELLVATEWAGSAAPLRGLTEHGQRRNRRAGLARTIGVLPTSAATRPAGTSRRAHFGFLAPALLLVEPQQDLQLEGAPSFSCQRGQRGSHGGGPLRGKRPRARPLGRPDHGSHTPTAWRRGRRIANHPYRKGTERRTPALEVRGPVSDRARVSVRDREPGARRCARLVTSTRERDPRRCPRNSR